jgi:hypothetical protein
MNTKEVVDYGPYYSIKRLAIAAEDILFLIDKYNLTFFSRDDIPFDRREILCSIQIGKHIESIDGKIPSSASPSIHLAVESVEIYHNVEIDDDDLANQTISGMLYMRLVLLIDPIINLILDVYQRTVEIKIQDKSYVDAIKYLTVERQSSGYDKTHPKKFIKRYKEYLAVCHM